MTEKLKPCPAGHETKLRIVSTIKDFYGFCGDCGWSGPICETQQQSAEEWNARAESAEVERLRARVAELEAAQAWRSVDSVSSPDEIDIRLRDGSILRRVIPQWDGDFWWIGDGWGERFIDRGAVSGWLPPMPEGS